TSWQPPVAGSTALSVQCVRRATHSRDTGHGRFRPSLSRSEKLQPAWTSVLAHDLCVVLGWVRTDEAEPRLMRIFRHALPILIAVLWAAPSLAQSLVCQPIRRGESAGQAARRVTGNSRNMYSASFQIMNDSSRFVPKSQYDRLGTGWRACVVRLPTRSTASAERRLDAPAVVAGAG